MTSVLSAEPRRGRRWALAAGAVLVSAALMGTTACGGGDSVTGPRSDPTGIYGLIAFNNQQAPVVIYNGPYYDPATNYTYDPFIIQVTGGEISLNDDGTFLLAMDLLLSANGRDVPQTMHIEGEYEARGSKVTLYDADDNPLVAQLKNGELSLPLGIRGKNGYAVFRHAP